MSWIKDLRESAGLAQWELADLLCINRSAINMAERDERDLPGDGNLRLLQIFNAMHALKDGTTVHETLPETRQTLAEKLKKEAAWLRIKMHPLKKKIAAQEAKYKTSDQLLLMITAIKQLHSAAPPKQREEGWLEHHTYRYKYTDKDKQLWQLQQLRLKLFALEAQAAEMERMAGEMGA